MYLVLFFIAALLVPTFGAIIANGLQAITLNGLNGLNSVGAIIANGLQAITLNGLNGNSLPLHSVRAQANDYPEHFLEIVPYLVRCALPQGQSLNVTIKGTEVNVYGELGLAPSLETIPMSTDEQKRVSACLLAHLTLFGHHVLISARNSPLSSASLVEIKAFRVFQGAFFGNIFNMTYVTKFSCVGDNESVALANSQDRQWRVCTNLDNKCDFKSLGKCSQVCKMYDPNLGFSQCTGNGVVYPAVNVFLKSNTLA